MDEIRQEVIGVRGHVATRSVEGGSGLALVVCLMVLKARYSETERLSTGQKVRRVGEPRLLSDNITGSLRVAVNAA